MKKIIAVVVALAFSAPLAQAQTAMEKVEKSGAANSQAVAEKKAKDKAEADAREKANKEARDKSRGEMKAKMKKNAEARAKKRAEDKSPAPRR